MKLIEAYGTGISKIISCYKGKSEQPVFESVEGAFQVILPNVHARNLSMEDAKYLPILQLFEYKKEITQYIQDKYGYEVINFGTDSTKRFNYPVAGEAVANAVISGEVDKGIVICGTGVGISLAANKVNGIRCVTCSEPYSAKLSREHNNTNMLAFGARVVGIELAKMIVDAWLTGEYEGGRHQVRIDMLKDIEEKQKKLYE